MADREPGMAAFSDETPTSGGDGATGQSQSAERARLRRIAVRVIIVQMLTLILLAVMQAHFSS